MGTLDTVWLQKLGEMTGVPCYVYQEQGLTFQWPEETRCRSLFDKTPGDLSRLWDTARAQQGTPFLFVVASYIHFAALSREGTLLVLGPVALTGTPKEILEQYRQRVQPDMELWMPVMSTRRFSRLISLVCYSLYQEQLDPDTLRILNLSIGQDTEVREAIDAASAFYTLESAEQEFDHRSQAYERRLLEIVRTGDVEAMSRMLYRRVKSFAPQSFWGTLGICRRQNFPCGKSFCRRV